MKETSLKVMATAAMLTGVTLATAATGAAGSNEDNYKARIASLPSVTEPMIPEYQVSIENFGGVADGTTLNTESFRKAIAHLSEKGGGTLVVPAGVWLTGPIELKSHIRLQVDEGALVLFSPNREDYPLVDSYFEGVESKRCMSPLTANGAEDIAITGRGMFNGNGQNWRPVKKSKMTAGQWKELCKSGAVNEKGDIWYPTEKIRDIDEHHDDYYSRAYSDETGAAWNEIHDYLRPSLLQFINCKRVLLEDATFENSPGWNIHPLMCEDVILRNVTIRNPWYAQNGDGLDLESCNRAIITGCSFDVGDDAICIKSGRDKEGRDRGMPTENVVISDCRVYHGHGGFVIGSEMSGGARNIHVNNCLFIGTDVGLRFKSTRGRGGVVEDIFISNIGMANIAGDAITFDLYYGGKAPLEASTDGTTGTTPAIPAIDETTPSFRNLYISDITCNGAKRAIYINGLPEMPIKNVNVSNSIINATQGVVLNYADGLTLDNVKITVEKGDTITQGPGVSNLNVK